MGLCIFLLAIALFLREHDSIPQKIRRTTTKINEKHPTIDVNISAITILIQEGNDEDLIVLYYPAIAKLISKYSVNHNDDIYRHKADFLSKFEKLRDRKAEKIASIQAEEIRMAKAVKIMKILALPVIIFLGFHINSSMDEVKAEKIRKQNETLANAYGTEVWNAFEQAALDGDSANTVDELSDGVGKLYLSPDLNFKGKKFYISDIKGFESYALLDDSSMCGEYSYTYEELVGRVKKYKFNNGCYDGKYFYMVKPVYSEEELKDIASNELKEEVKRLKSEIEALKTNNR